MDTQSALKNLLQDKAELDKDKLQNWTDYNIISLSKEKAYELYLFRSQFLKERVNVYNQLVYLLSNLKSVEYSDILLHGFFLETEFYLFFTDEKIKDLIGYVNFGSGE